MAKKKTGFAELFQELETLTTWFERGEPDLDQGLEKMKQAQILTAELKQRLVEAENVVHQIAEQRSSDDELSS